MCLVRNLKLHTENLRNLKIESAAARVVDNSAFIIMYRWLQVEGGGEAPRL